MTVRLAAIAGLSLFLGSACFEENPCDRFVTYVCDCHDGEEGYDCEEMQRIYAGADPDLQDSCQTDLTALQNLDDESGIVCDAGDSGI